MEGENYTPLESVAAYVTGDVQPAIDISTSARPTERLLLASRRATGGRVAITTAIATIGRTAEPPWAADQRHAAAAAWLALS